jgi:putative exosortase-associated protein (TIGR04073 family)
MRHPLFSLLGGLALVTFVAGCAGPEQKLGRGMSNTMEIFRGGEMRRSIEHATIFEYPEAGYTTGVVRGVNRTLARTGLGLWEMLTFPFPNQSNPSAYNPIGTRYVAANPVYPDSYRPGILGGDSTLETDSNVGMSGGDVAPFIPGSRFSIFGN